MQAKTLFTAGILAIAASTAYGRPTDNTFNPAGGSGNWSSAGSWSQGTVPDAADRVVIASGKTANFDVSSATIGALNVASTAVLNIQANNTLSIDGVADTGVNGQHNIDGSLILKGAGSTVSFITTDQTVQGSGLIQGENDGAILLMGPSRKVSNRITIAGALQIRASSGTATLENVQLNSTPRAALRADYTMGTLQVASSVILNEVKFTSLGTDYYTKYEAVDADGAVLRFDGRADGLGGSVVLDGDFVIDGNGFCSTKMEINHDFQTNGCLSFTQGMLVVGASSGLFTDGCSGGSPYSPGTYDSVACP